MTATGRLFWIETRRSAGLWAFPILAGLAGLAWLTLNSESGEPVALWPEASVGIGLAVTFVGPAAGGLAAWAAGRDRRRGLEDLLATTPAPAARRELTLLTATALWALLAYLVAAVVLGILTAREATWGGPVAPPILLAALAIAVQAAIGYAIGSFAGSRIASRLTTALVPVGLFVAQLVPTMIEDEVQIGPRTLQGTLPYENVSPFGVVQNVAGTIFWSPQLEIAWYAAIWLLGLGGLALALVVLCRRRSLGGWGVLAASALAVGFGWTQLVPAPLPALASHGTAPIAYEPVCTQRSIPICLHPAYEAVLDETADVVDPIIRPLVGLPGFPSRAEQPRPPYDGDPAEIWSGGASTPDTLPILPPCTKFPPQAAPTAVALAAVNGLSDVFAGVPPAQAAIAVWLLRQAGWEPTAAFVVGTCLAFNSFAEAHARIEPETLRAADRFGALPPEEQRAWLEANLAALRAGELTLEDLP